MGLRIILNLAAVSVAIVVAAPSCYSSGDNDDAVAGGGAGGTAGAGGKACSVPADCDAPLFCAADLGRCVECVDDRHCTGADTEVCVDHQCVPPGSGGGAPGAGGQSASAGNDAGGSSSGGAGAVGATNAGGEPGQAGSGAGGDGPVDGCGPLIDDMEDSDGTVCLGSGRQGQWFTWVGTGTINPPASTGFPASFLLSPRVAGSNYAMHFWGTVSTTAGIGVPFNSPYADFNNIYDGSAYSGITFWARAESAISVSIEIRTYAVELTLYGGGCTVGCLSNSYGPIAVGTEWQEYTVPFGSMAGGSAGFDASTLLNIQFITSGTFDLWIDDPAFY